LVGRLLRWRLIHGLGHWFEAELGCVLSDKRICLLRRFKRIEGLLGLNALELRLAARLDSRVLYG